MRGVPEEAVHDVLPLRVHPVDDGEEGHPVLHSPDDHLEVRVTNLGQEDVQAGPLLKSPAVLVGPVRVDQQSGKLYKIIMSKRFRKRQQQRKITKIYHLIHTKSGTGSPLQIGIRALK